MSFYLRKVNKETKQTSNIALGESYSVTRKEQSEQIFFNMLDNMPWIIDLYIDRIFAIVSDESGRFLALSESDDNYIVTERGSTFERIM